MRGRILVIGVGQLGSDVLRVGQARGLDIIGFDRKSADITDRPAIERAVRDAAPSIVLNCASFTNVEAAEDEAASAFHVNAVGALHVARAATSVGARVAYVSTDFVFDGTKGTAYVESDAPRPINTYGASKLAGEHATLYAGQDPLVVRVSSLFGVSGARGKGGNFIETILRNAKEKGALKVVMDQTMTPTYTLDAANALLELVERDAKGIVHAANAGACTWHAFASEAVRLCGLHVPVEPVPASAWPSKARRPANSALDTRKLSALLGAPPRSWQSALDAYLREKGHR